MLANVSSAVMATWMPCAVVVVVAVDVFCTVCGRVMFSADQTDSERGTPVVTGPSVEVWHLTERESACIVLMLSLMVVVVMFF